MCGKSNKGLFTHFSELKPTVSKIFYMELYYVLSGDYDIKFWHCKLVLILKEHVLEQEEDI